MSKNRDSDSIIDLYNAGQKVVNFARSCDREVLFADEMRLSAILYQIAIMGEATKRLSPKFRRTNSQISWREIAGIRDILIHNYDNVKLYVVWDIVHRDVPELLQ